jgi:hypothetical protein
VTVVEGDVRETAVILQAVRPRGHRPDQTRLLAHGALLHFFPAPAVRDLVAG